MKSISTAVVGVVVIGGIFVVGIVVVVGVVVAQVIKLSKKIIDVVLIIDTNAPKKLIHLVTLSEKVHSEQPSSGAGI